MRALLLLSLLPCWTIAAQPIVPDTLDWRGYYPLEVGNAWEWKTEILVGLFIEGRRDIAGDTLVGGRRYFVQTEFEHTNFRGTIYIRRDTLLVRYDTLGMRVVQYAAGPERGVTCDLSAPFGGRSPCEDWGGELYVGGNYTPRWPLVVMEDTIALAAVKYLYSLGGGVEYFHSIGWLEGIGDGNLGETKLVYVRVGGRTYGRPQVVTSAEVAEPQARASFLVFPNPTRGIARIRGVRPGETIHVYDVRGREVSQVVCTQEACEVDASLWPTGLYVVRADAQRASRVFAVVK